MLVHALWYAGDLQRHGHTVKIVFEGEATRALGEPRLLEAIKHAQELGIVAGICKAASHAMGCSKDPAVREAMTKDGWKSPLHTAAEGAGIALLSDMHGHASIAEYIAQGFELVIF